MTLMGLLLPKLQGGDVRLFVQAMQQVSTVFS